MLCPRDQNPFDTQTVESDGRFVSVKQCSICKSIFIDQDELQYIPPSAVDLLDNGRRLSFSLVSLKCPRDQAILKKTSMSSELGIGYLQCGECNGIWFTPGQMTSFLRATHAGITSLVGLAVRTVGVFALALGTTISLFSIQYSTVSADLAGGRISQISSISLAIWIITFFMLFLVPLSIYVQVVVQDKHISAAIRHPLAYIFPIVVVAIAVINAFVIFPNFS